MTTLTRGTLGQDVESVLAVIRQAGGHPMLVGGCVRDAILNPGSQAKDIDVEVYGLPDFGRLAAAMAGNGFTVNEVGVSFGVLLVRAGDTDMDVSLPRRDSKTGAGHRGFTITPDTTLGFAEASSRREYTIGALMADPVTGEVIDCHGGLADLASGVLRHTSAAFTEDPLRVLRAVQFAARFSFRLAPETAVLCRSIADAYAELAIERVWGEVWKLGTMGKDITAGLRVLAETGWERHFPPVAILHSVPQDPEWHPEGNVHIHSGLAADQAARLADEAGLTPNGSSSRSAAVTGQVRTPDGSPSATPAAMSRPDPASSPATSAAAGTAASGWPTSATPGHPGREPSSAKRTRPRRTAVRSRDHPQDPGHGA